MASSQLYGSVISPKGKSFVSPIVPTTHHLTPRVSLGQHSAFSNLEFVSPKGLLVPLHVKKTVIKPPKFGSKSGAGVPSSNLDEADTNKKHAKLHDFCLGIPYGGLLFIMGLIGYVIHRSPVSLFLGVIPGFVTAALGAASMRAWKNHKSNSIFIIGQEVIAFYLVWQYSEAYMLTRKFLPWGFYFLLSGAMVCFFAYVMFSGGNPPPEDVRKKSVDVNE